MMDHQGALDTKEVPTPVEHTRMGSSIILLIESLNKLIFIQSINVQ